MGGRRGGANPGAYQEGMAPDAQLYSGATSTQWKGKHYAASNPSTTVKFDQFRRAFSTGMNAAGRRADVINSSWGIGRRVARDRTRWRLALMDSPIRIHARCLLSVPAITGRVLTKYVSPASAYNNMSVAALGPNPPYSRPAIFSSGGPNDYADPVNGTANDARQVVDIAAPGENLSSAYYGGETGGNGTTDNPAVSGSGPTGPPSGPAGGPDFYPRRHVWHQLRRPDRGRRSGAALRRRVLGVFHE